VSQPVEHVTLIVDKHEVRQLAAVRQQLIRESRRVVNPDIIISVVQASHLHGDETEG